MEAIWKPLSRSSLILLFVVVLTIGAFVSTRLLDSSSAFMDGDTAEKSVLTSLPLDNYTSETQKTHPIPQKHVSYPLNCSIGNLTHTCPANYYPSKISLETKDLPQTPPSTCPDYFRWIHNDLWPWRETGITREMVRSAKRTANFRLVVLNGTAYVEVYRESFQSRGAFTLWGILQLLRRYPGKVPDLDLMFDTVDWPVIKKDYFKGPTFPGPPPLFRYCSNVTSYDIVFPDWSFWGWPEINIKPWNALLKELKEGNERTSWTDRESHAYWKGNPVVAATRMDLLKCNVSNEHDWGARVYAQDWLKEKQEGYKQSDLASQCVHRFKIYIEGSAWSVSEKYILACDSVSLLVTPHYYDFFTRSLIPLKHYWPIKEDDKCKSIKYAVDWGNGHQKEAQAIGKAASKFIQEELKMDYVYDYMLHLLTEYSKLLKYKPSIPRKAVELCSELMACNAQGVGKKFMVDSLVDSPHSTPCTMPPPFDPASLHSVLDRREETIKKVETWEKQHWDSQNQNKQT